MADYKWYSTGIRPHGDGRTVEILGWSRDRMKAIARTGTIEAYYASSREMAARKAKADRGFDIQWRKYNAPQRAEMAQMNLDGFQADLATGHEGKS